MPTFVMLTRLSPAALKSPASLEKLEQEIMSRIRTECPTVEWLQNLAVLGAYDYVDVFRAPDLETAMKVSVVVRTFGHARTEILPGQEWKQFKDLVRNLPGGR